jgi:hypothetical protein
MRQAYSITWFSTLFKVLEMSAIRPKVNKLRFSSEILNYLKARLADPQGVGAQGFVPLTVGAHGRALLLAKGNFGKKEGLQVNACRPCGVIPEGRETLWD